MTSNPAGIRCGSDCTELYAAGTVVTLDREGGSRYCLYRLVGSMHRLWDLHRDDGRSQDCDGDLGGGGGGDSFLLTVTRAGTGTWKRL